MSEIEHIPLSYEQFEGKIYQYVGDSMIWAERVQKNHEDEGRRFIPLDLQPFVSGFDPKHREFRDSIKDLWESVDKLQARLGEIAVGSGVWNNQPRVGIYVLATDAEYAPSAIKDIAEL